MKASELIEQLQNIIKEHGDLDIIAHFYHADPVASVEYWDKADVEQISSGYFNAVGDEQAPGAIVLQ